LNLLLLFESDREGGDRFMIDGPRFVHLRDVLKCELGATLEVGLLNAAIGRGTIVQWGLEACAIDVQFARTPERPKTDLILALPRPKVLRRILPELVAMGLGRLILLRSWRVEKSYLKSDVLNPEIYRPLLHQGLMQAKCTVEPEVVFESQFKPFVEDRCPAYLHERIAFVCDPGATKTFAAYKLDPTQNIVLAVGPEGGWIEYELNAFARAGFETISLGPRVLKVETACAALLGQISLLRA
jgi:RsmE family RNA methyltransferase